MQAGFAYVSKDQMSSLVVQPFRCEPHLKYHSWLGRLPAALALCYCSSCPPPVVAPPLPPPLPLPPLPLHVACSCLHNKWSLCLTTAAAGRA